MTSCHMFVWGYFKVCEYVPHPSQFLEELKHRIEESATTGSKDIPQKLWEESDFHKL
jgi:hypothetical protein